jgi:hypothetical protein
MTAHLYPVPPFHRQRLRTETILALFEIYSSGIVNVEFEIFNDDILGKS